MFTVLLKIFYLILTVAMAYVLSGCTSFTNPEKKYKPIVEQAPFDVVIVPGFPHQEDNNWNIVTKCRVCWAVFLYKNGVAKNILFSGGAVYTPYVESEVMALYAEKMGIPKKHIFVETKAEHTSENLYYSYQLAKEKGFTRIAVASDALQCTFLQRFRRKFELNDVQFIPIVYDSIGLKECGDPKIDTRAAYVKDFVSLKERESFFKRYKATHGYKVKQLMKREREKKLEEDFCSAQAIPLSRK